VSDEPYVLDTSALFAYMTDERGADLIEKILASGEDRVFIPWPVLFEIYYVTRRRLGEKEADRRYVLIKELPATFIWQVDEPVLLTGARLKSQFRLSFADALIAAIAIRRNALLVHKDPEYEALGKILRQKSLK